ncbi:MAG: hypothetical protein KJ002_02615 [Candidatus Dadabacteria bacterium]|nr:hypothetical protein [Candidatus Dadabacteria bacterium]
MKRINGSIIFPVLLSGAWGVIVLMFYGFFSGTIIPYGLYYPLLLSGAAAASGIFRGVPLGRAAFVGFAAGFVYTLLSFTSPLLGAALAGACLGGGISRGGKPGILLQALKGALLFPVFVISGVYIGSLAYSGPLPTVLLWASWLGLAVGVITTPFFKTGSPSGINDLDDRVRNFTAEASSIEVDLRELYERMR